MADQVVTNQAQPIILKVEAATPAPVDNSDARREKRESKIADAKAEGANEVLKSLGVKKSERSRMIEEIRGGRMKLAEAKDAAAAANQAAAKLDAESQAQADAFKPWKDQVEQLTGALKEYADAEFNALPEAFQKTIVEMKLDDPQKRLDMIKVFKKTGVLGGATQAAKTEETAPAAKKTPAPSTTMATPPGAKDSPAGQALNYYEQWKAMSDRGEHYLAAQYMNAYSQKIMEQRPSTR